MKKKFKSKQLKTTTNAQHLDQKKIKIEVTDFAIEKEGTMLCLS
jgi:hypothetical protein